METDLLTRNTVSLGFGIGNDSEDLYCQGLGACTEAASLQDIHNLGKAAMLMVVMVVVIVVVVVMVMIVVMMVAMKVFHIVVVVVLGQDHIKVTRIYAGFCNAAHTRSEAVKRESFKGFLKHAGVNSQVKKGRHGHIAAYSGVTFKVKCLFHRWFLFLMC